MTSERTGVYKMRDTALTLIGENLEVGSKAPGFTLVANDMSRVTLDDSKGKTRVIAAVNSLDTGVCDTEAKALNEMAKELPDVDILVVRKDLPFAQ